MQKVFMIGNLTRDPELSETASGISVCKFSIAVNRNYGGEDRKTDFFNVVAWRGLGENVARYAKKGNKVAVSGSIELRNYEDNEGIKRTAVDIVAQEVEFLTPRSNDGHGDVGHDVPKGNSRSGAQSTQQQLISFDDDDSDIPF